MVILCESMGEMLYLWIFAFGGFPKGARCKEKRCVKESTMGGSSSLVNVTRDALS